VVDDKSKHETSQHFLDTIPKGDIESEAKKHNVSMEEMQRAQMEKNYMHSSDIDQHHRDQTNYSELNQSLGRMVQRPVWKQPSLNGIDKETDKKCSNREVQVRDVIQPKTPINELVSGEQNNRFKTTGDVEQVEVNGETTCDTLHHTSSLPCSNDVNCEIDKKEQVLDQTKLTSPPNDLGCDEVINRFKTTGEFEEFEVIDETPHEKFNLKSSFAKNEKTPSVQEPIMLKTIGTDDWSSPTKPSRPNKKSKLTNPNTMDEILNDIDSDKTILTAGNWANSKQEQITSTSGVEHDSEHPIKCSGNLSEGDLKQPFGTVIRELENMRKTTADIKLNNGLFMSSHLEREVHHNLTLVDNEYSLHYSGIGVEIPKVFPSRRSNIPHSIVVKKKGEKKCGTKRSSPSHAYTNDHADNGPNSCNETKKSSPPPADTNDDEDNGPNNCKEKEISSPPPAETNDDEDNGPNNCNEKETSSPPPADTNDDADNGSNNNNSVSSNNSINISTADLAWHQYVDDKGQQCIDYYDLNNPPDWITKDKKEQKKKKKKKKKKKQSD